MVGATPQGVLSPVLIRMLEGRVGSTLVMQLLATSSAVTFDRVYPFENSYLTYLERLSGQLAGATSAGAPMVDLLYGDRSRIGPLPFQPASLDGAQLASGALRALWSTFSATMRASAAGPVSFYAEKYWGHPATLAAAGLDPVLIDLVRDPRDIVASIRAFNAKGSRQLFGRAAAADDDDHLRRLVAGMALRLRDFEVGPPSPRLLVRYEDLVADFPGEARRISSIIGVDLDASAAAATRSAMAHHITSRSLEASVGRWQQDLSPADIRVIERRLGLRMDALGYSLSGFL